MADDSLYRILLSVWLLLLPTLITWLLMLLLTVFERKLKKKELNLQVANTEQT